MGTRCLTEVRSRWGEGEYRTNAVIYRHWDGYLDGHGKDLFNYIKDISIVNGKTSSHTENDINGAGRFASYLVCKMMSDRHEPRLIGEVIDCGQEYHYRVDITEDPSGGEMVIFVFGGPMTAFGFGGDECDNLLFSGTVDEYGEYLIKSETED